MKFTYPHYLLTMLFIVFFCLIFQSCAKDSDLFYEYVVEQEEEVVETDDPDENSEDPDEENPDEGNEEDPDEGNEEDPDEGEEEPDIPEFPDTPDDPGNPNKIEGTYYPKSADDVANPANASFKAVITDSFDCNNCTFAPNQTIEPAGGVITGSNINLNGAYIQNTYKQAFAPSVRFSTLYENSRVSPETFGAVSGDNVDDNAAIDAMINNCALAVGTKDGSYIKNRPSNYNRGGIINWNLNGAEVKITSAANFRTSLPSVDAVFDMTNISPTIYNGEFDGTDAYGRLFYLHGQNHFSFRNLWVHNLYSPNAIRAVAFRFSINATSSGFSAGEFRDNVIEDIVAQGDGNYNDTHGIAKAWWYSFSGMNSSTNFHILYQNNVVRNIIGDDAEGFYAIGGANVSHNGRFTFDNEDYRNCTRRAIKVCVSNVEIKNSYFEEIPQSMFNSAQQMGSMVDFFSTSSGNLIENIWIHDNVIRTVPGHNAHYYLLSVTDAKNVIIENNTITMENAGNYGGIRLGSNTSIYSGALQNVKIRNNILNNTYVNTMTKYAPVNNQPIEIDNNEFNFTSTLGVDVGALRFSARNGAHGYINFTNNDINVNMSSPNGINGVLASNGVDVVGVTLDNVNVTYSNGSSARPFGYLQGSFNSSNTIKNSSLTGANGAQSLVVNGSQSAQIVNSTDSNGNPITMK
ncbi:hypothetical protein [Flagellimonas myxillae]|uniref:hypothetical protein n=1 Tax=Flagellimonas myxillae TaxID=2942214 RepID=UPI00201F484A|nr:hypothetical protein [Muricauda myxillae]MCL6266242.1 hypothetical protein [Muricauda myxillae]